jgi:chromosomal replication initiator protein
MTELDQFWPACLARLEAELSSQQFNTWIKPLAAEANEEGIALFAPNRFIMQFIKDRFLGRIEELAVELVGEAPVELRLGAPSSKPLAVPTAVSNGVRKPAPPQPPATTPPARPSRPR